MNPCLRLALVQPRILGVTPSAGEIAVVRAEEDARRSRVYSLTLYAEEYLRYWQKSLFFSSRFPLPPNSGVYEAERTEARSPACGLGFLGRL